MKIAIIGAGLIGQAWAIVFARGGCQVRVWDGDSQALARAHELIARQVRELRKQELLSDAEGVLSRIQGSRTEERRVGYECVSPCSYRWSAYHTKKKKRN